MTKTQYTAEAPISTSRVGSRQIWSRLPSWNQLEPDEAFKYFEDFGRHAPVTAEDVVEDVSDDKAAITYPSTTHIGGYAKLAITAGDDNEEVFMTGLYPWLEIDSDTGDCGFEMCWRTNSVADDVAIAVGASILIAAGDDEIQDADTGALNTTIVSFVGHNTLCADGNALIANYKTAGTATSTTGMTNTVLTADVWHTSGFVYNQESGTIELFHNDTSNGTVQYDATNFPNGLLLTWLAAAKVGSTGAAVELDLDWIKLKV
jgi:hypothetical protein